jgi:hypothetical protein
VDVALILWLSGLDVFQGWACARQKKQTVNLAAQGESAANAHRGRLLGYRRQSILDLRFEILNFRIDPTDKSGGK